jgi:hypothetical protein
LNLEFPPPFKGAAVAAEVVIILVVAWVSFSAWRRGRRSRLHAVTAGAGSALAVASLLVLLAPNAAHAYSLAGITQDLFTYSPCSEQFHERAQLAVQGTGRSLTLTYDVSRGAISGETFWVVLFSERSTPQMYFANTTVSPDLATTGHHTLPITLGPGVTSGSSRQVWLVCATDRGSTQLLQYQTAALNSDRAYDNIRRGLPDGVVYISNGVHNITTDV